ncbi:MAG: hypothetical protein WBC88_12265 [Candidatus Zixiibacteriota bacterium]
MRIEKYLVLLFVIALAALLFFSILEVSVASTLGFPLDDSWIFWVFAKNLATGQGFSFNPGDPVLGTTSILWVFILAGSYLLTHNVIFISKFWGILLFLLSIFLTYRICLFYTQRREIAFLAVLTFALAPPLIFGALSGMEISLATLLVCLTLYFLLKEKGKGKKIFLAPIFGALCFTARPELISLYPLLLVHDWVNRENRGDQREYGAAWSTILKKAFTFMIFLSPAFIFSYFVTGSLLPNTLAAKTMDSGLIWAIKNGNLDELIISLTLNPVVWGGTMLISLVSLNALWAVFWGRGVVFSFLRRDTFIYPLIFLLIPMLRGVVAPVTNSFYGEQRYVSFLLPLVAVFFVMGLSRSKESTDAGGLKSSVRKWLYCLGGVAFVVSVIFYLNPLVAKDEILRFLAGSFFPSVLNFASFKFVFPFTVFFIILMALLGSARFFTERPAGKKVAYVLLIAGVILQAGFLLNRGQFYALSVKNINEMQVHLGKWVSRNIPQGSLVAVNDVGAIKFFGDRECLDLEGLVSPEMVPYKIMGRESRIVYLNRHRPDYFVIFPLWYPEVYTYLGLRENVLYEAKLEDNVACGGAVMKVSTPDWRLFDSTFQNTGILDVRPYIPTKSFRRRWYDAQQRQVLPPDWKVYERMARESWIKKDFKEAEKFFRKAESYDPQDHEFYLYMAGFYQEKGNQGRANWAIQKAMYHQLFPPALESGNKIGR